jgi:hypothetical protein
VLGRSVVAAEDTTVGGEVLIVPLAQRMLCASCDFSEEWVDDKAGLDKLSAKYNPLNQALRQSHPRVLPKDRFTDKVALALAV